MESDGDIDSCSDYADENSDYCNEEVYLDDEDDYIDDHNSKRSYHILNENEIRKRQLEDISHVSDLLSLPLVSATRLLHHYKWNVSHLHDEWFSDEGQVRPIVGLPGIDEEDGVFSSGLFKEGQIVCGICFDQFDQFDPEDFYSLSCRHLYCKTCWKGYLTASIMDGLGCLSLRCPEPSCQVAVCGDTIEELASKEEKEKYSRFVLTSFVEVNKRIKWCPAPGCDNAVELESGDEIFDVTCLCKGIFCWRCGEDAHRPVNCETVRNWVLKNRSESENTAWILANSKPCPKCKTPIEKNQGCMHMVCKPPCKYEFCWLCLGDWQEHGKSTGGYYACNKYDKAKQEGLYDEEEKIRQDAKSSVEKYTHYYKRWAFNQRSREKAIESLKEVETDTIQQLASKLKETEFQLKFITEAWEQIIECRRVLKWTYAYGYYLPENKNKYLFEFSQGQAEARLEELHKFAETAELRFVSGAEVALKSEFNIFRQNLLDLTNVTRSYFSTLVEYLESHKL